VQVQVAGRTVIEYDENGRLSVALKKMWEIMTEIMNGPA